MNCGRARTNVALWAGGDLDDQESGQLERHLAVCPQCRDYRTRIAGSLQALREPQGILADNLYDSVWPKVASRLAVKSQADARRAERLNRWLPVAAAAAVCLAVIALTSEPEPRRQDVFGQSLPAERLNVWGSLQPDSQPVSVGGQPAQDSDANLLQPGGDRGPFGWQNGRGFDYDER
jgi:hypothetical protein